MCDERAGLNAPVVCKIAFEEVGSAFRILNFPPPFSRITIIQLSSVFR